MRRIMVAFDKREPRRPGRQVTILVRLYAAYQASAGRNCAVVVGTLRKRLTGCRSEPSDFKPYPFLLARRCTARPL